MMAQQPQRLILASASPRRRDLLQSMGLRFDVLPAEVDEDNCPHEGPAAMVAANAVLKARSVGQDIPEALVLGSDTTVALQDEVLNKPVDLMQARAMLRRLSGRQHVVYTAVALIWQAGGYEENFVEASRVHFKDFGDARIDRYIQLVDPLDKAGAYGIQQARDLIIERVEGSVENVMGLPIQALERKLAEHGFNFKV